MTKNITNNIQCKDSTSTVTIDIPIVTNDVLFISQYERMILYDMAGNTLHSVKNVYSICEACFNALLWQGKKPHAYELVTQLNDYGDHCLVGVSEETCYLES